MKTKIYLRRLINMKLIMVLSVFAILFAFSSCGMSNSSEESSEEIASPSLPTPADQPFVEVDEMPVFPDGDQAIIDFIAKNTTYPDEAKKNNITGKVIVRFVVEKDCTVSDIAIVKGADPLLDDEAVRVVGMLPHFETPAKKDGKAVRVYYMLPITFALK